MLIKCGAPFYMSNMGVRYHILGGMALPLRSNGMPHIRWPATHAHVGNKDHIRSKTENYGQIREKTLPRVNTYKHECYLAEILVLSSPMLSTTCAGKGDTEALFSQ